MKKEELHKRHDRENEKGAAMIMALLVSFLLLVASAGVLLETSLNSANVTDATADQQAYNAAESGIQSAVNVLRGNVTPNPLIDSSKPATDPANKINFVKALTVNTSNAPADSTGFSRLSRWMTYNYTPSGATNADRVTLGSTTYTAQNGYAFSLSISDPDNTGTYVSYSSTGRLFDSDADTTQKTYGSGLNTLKFKYTPVAITNLDVTSGSTATNVGKFTVTQTGIGATISAFNRFEIVLRMTQPYSAYRVLRGYIEVNNCSGCLVIPKIIFDSQTFTLMGSTINLGFNLGSNVYFPNASPQRVGYEAQLLLGDNIITGTISPPEPTRLLIKSIGYGPRGARKQLEAIIQKNFFNGLTAPATLTLVGPASTTTPPTTFLFNPGSSNVTQYSGDDVVSTDIISPIGTTNPDNLDVVQASIDGQPPHPFNGVVIGTPSDIAIEMPDWLASPLKLDTAVKSLYTVASSSGRYYATGVTPPNFGNESTAQGITFCDGNVSFTGSGGGILVVTGTLTLHGNFSFNGLIIVTGPGGVLRSGGGTGTLQGNIVIAPYLFAQISDNQSPTASSIFLSPQYDLSGGGNSTITYNSSSVANGLLAIDNFVIGVAEK
jgi:hypothetical protein